mmetsp:Transcript_16089/g.30922  ORF Transcript_16089/g.30922 Transcript_16089/m.30922 type:complete len:377 (-) Transcript_16089:457-1587(-)|eukprot:CAMPEP_0114248644 /NCGR_PEP_ID=MMETSP0058-20121206/13689_1 /TAXON_ID=36894 /ORGANISM="Pyramimonas parkeae, CCMP726" /LENGTH=376 /DNA_ID=CAMNT_0001362077 /DNA_START=72 /DNA_END=1202 /DNA_ORIENTATION=+
MAPVTLCASLRPAASRQCTDAINRSSPSRALRLSSTRKKSVLSRHAVFVAAATSDKDLKQKKGEFTDEGVFAQKDEKASNPSFDDSEMERRTLDATERVRVLSDALPNIQNFRGRTVVVKYGGAAMKDENLKELVVKDLVLLWCLGLRPVMVHGGGPEINKWLSKLNIAPEFSPSGLRITDGPTMDIVEMVLVGRVNKSLVTLISQMGGKAVGICGKDANLVTAEARDFAGLGFVGDVKGVDVGIIKDLVEAGVIPVVASVAADKDGNALNINADTVAGEIAAGLDAEKLILMTDVPGIMVDKDDPNTIISKATIKEINQLTKDGIIQGGMIPKVQCCVTSLAQGVKAAHIIDGRQPHSLLVEIMSKEGSGTMITG